MTRHGAARAPESGAEEAGAPDGIRDSLERILSGYERARAGEPFGREHEIWAAFRRLRQSLADRPVVGKRPTIEVSWSAGAGAWAKLPRVALLDTRETRTTRQGVYAAFLFRQDLSGVYLALNQGVTEPRRQLGRAVARSTLHQRAADLRAFCDALPARGFRLDDLLDLRGDSDLAGDYEAAVVAHKLYEAGEVPDDATLEQDLDALLRAYERYIRGRRSRAVIPAFGAVRERPRPTPTPRWEPVRATGELIDFIERRGFVFEPWQIAAYVAALRTKPFAILAGVSGTGKSRLPALVAEATGGAARLLPVRPDWTDSAEVLGYADLGGSFRPGALLDVAREAAEHPRRHWTCVLDEMNLARVEHFFAEVLSRIEQRSPAPRGGFRSDPLLAPTVGAPPEWAGVALPPNLALVGTVNMDESAHGFSRKVLDRAFTLELSDVDLARWESAPSGAAEPVRWPTSAWFPRAIRLGDLADPSGADRDRIRRVVEALGAVNRSLAPAGLQAGYRTRDEMALFLLHAAEIAPCFTTRAGEPVDPLDLALHMKILPRIVGGSGAVRRATLGLLGWAWSGTELRSEADGTRILDAWKAAGRPGTLPQARFGRTATRLCLMWERFLTEGFTSFWA